MAYGTVPLWRDVRYTRPSSSLPVHTTEPYRETGKHIGKFSWLLISYMDVKHPVNSYMQGHPTTSFLMRWNGGMTVFYLLTPGMEADGKSYEI